MDTVVKAVTNLRIVEKIRDDDMVDQLHHVITVYLFLGLGLFIGLTEMAGSPMDCWVAPTTWKHYQSYVNSYCMSHGLYRYPNSSNLTQMPYTIQEGTAQPPENISDNGDISLYKGITILFILQAIMFKLPGVLWSSWNEGAGIQLERMVAVMKDMTLNEKDSHETAYASLASFLETWLRISRKPHLFMKNVGVNRNRFMPLRGGSLSFTYLTTKFLFLINVVIQFIILSVFLMFNFFNFAPDIIDTLSEGHPSFLFPRVGLCHFQLKGEGHWFQCNLPINVYLAHILLIEWFWLIFLLIVTFINFIVWMLKILQTDRSVEFVRRYLNTLHPDFSIPQDGPKTVDNFVRNYLGNDGVFILRILATNTNDVAMAEFLRQVWKRFLDCEKLCATTTNAIENDEVVLWSLDSVKKQ